MPERYLNRRSFGRVAMTALTAAALLSAIPAHAQDNSRPILIGSALSP